MKSRSARAFRLIQCTAMQNAAAGLANDLRPLEDARRRRGCLSGCGPGCIGKLLLFLAAGVVFFIALHAVFNPYAFTLGGHFHWYPVWIGVGRVHSNAAGGDYLFMCRSNRLPRHIP